MKLEAAAVLGVLSLAAAPLVFGQGSPSNARVVRSDVMTGYQEAVPPPGPGTISTTGIGEFVAEIDERTQTITYELTYSGLEGLVTTQAHIHFGARGTTGGISAFLCGGTKPACPPNSAVVVGVITAADIIGPGPQGIEPGNFAELVLAMRSGMTYVNVHTDKWTTGEIRGQVHDHNERQVK